MTLPTEDYSSVLPIFVFDESGSMRQELRSAIEGARQLIRGYLENNCPEVVVIRYHTEATTFTYHTLEEVDQFTARAQGMTNFPAAIKEIITAIDHANRSNHQPRIYFMTDGQNTAASDMLGSSIDQLKLAVTSSKVPSTIDVIGFTDYHDVNLLNGFAQMTGEGTFQYAESGPVLEEIVSNLLMVSSNKCTVDLSWGGHNMRVTAVRDDDGVYRVVHQTTKEPSAEIKVHVTGRDPVYIPMIQKELSPDSLQRFQIQTIRDTLQDLTQRVNQLYTQPQREAFDKDLRTVDTDIDAMVGNGDLFRDMSREQRTIIRQAHLEFKDTVSQLYNARTSNISTAEYAMLLSSSSAHITKPGLQKKLQQRVISNMNNNDHIVAKELGKQLKFTKAITDDDPVCMLTLQNYQELAESGDCLCICLSVSRSQSAIADPSQVRIRKIQPTLLSLDAFRDAVDLKLVSADDSSTVHGGFQHSLGESSTVIEGMAREKINAVFPVYFDEQSWSVARLRMKEAFSWISTITWNGWSFSQVEILPLMVLAHALREYNTNPNEINKRTLDLLTRTCQVIATFHIDDGTLADRQLKQLSNFMDNPLHRTVDAVPCLPALVGAAWCLSQDTFQDPHFMEYVWEEYFRRELRWQLSNCGKTEVLRMIAAKLHIDLNKYTNVLVTAGSESAAAARVRDMLGFTGGHETISGSAQLTSEEWVWRPSVILPGDIQQAQQTWIIINNWFGSNSHDLLADDVFLGATIQNMLQASNSSRRESIQEGVYIKPFNYPDSLIIDIGKKAIEHFRALEWARHTASQGNDHAAEFAGTSDLFQAEA